MAADEALRLPLSCPLIINGEEGKAGSGRRFARENPANIREVATLAEEGTQEDARAAIDAARTAFDSNVGNWIYNYKLREQVLFRTARLMRENADRLARVVSLEVGMPMRQAGAHIGAAADIFEFYAGLAGKLYGERFTLPSGGKAPYVSVRAAELEAASRAAIFGMLRNGGQACGATTRLLVQEGIHERFLARVVELTRKIDVGHPSKPSTDMGPLISSNQEKVVQEFIQYGVDKGFRLLTGGHKLKGDGYDQGY